MSAGSIKITIDLGEFRSRVSRAGEQLRADLRAGVLDAARQGIEEARRNHPYTDRTGTLSGYQAAEDGRATSAVVQEPSTDPDEEYAAMEWPPFYASFVDEGTSRSRPYPYTPQAVQTAEKALEENVKRAVEKFEKNLHQ